MAWAPVAGGWRVGATWGPGLFSFSPCRVAFYPLRSHRKLEHVGNCLAAVVELDYYPKLTNETDGRGEGQRVPRKANHDLIELGIVQTLGVRVIVRVKCGHLRPGRLVGSAIPFPESA